MAARRQPAALLARAPRSTRARGYSRAAQQVRLRARQHEAIAKLGEQALSGMSAAQLMDAALAALRDVLEIEFAKVLELSADGDSMLLKAGIGWQQGLVGKASLVLEGHNQADFTLTSDRPVIVPDCDRETRFTIPAILGAHGVASGMSVIIRGRDRPYGVLGVHSTRRRRFSADDAHLLASAANILGMAIDHERWDAQLRASEGRLRAFFEHSPLLVNLRDRDGRYLMLNRHYRDVFGVEPASLVGKDSVALHGELYGNVSAQAVRRVIEEQRPVILVAEVPTPRGARTFLTTRFPILAEDGGVAVVGTIGHDVTTIREAQTQLRQYRDLLEGITDTIPVTVAYVDANGVYRWINRRGAERHGRSRDAIVGNSMFEIWGASICRQTLEDYLRRVLAGETVSYESAQEQPDGTTQQIETHLTPTVGPQGTVDGFCVLTVDVTERQRAREALQAAYADLEQRVAERTGQLAAAHHEAEALSYSIAHDLRAPLRAISGYARIVLEDLAGSVPAEAMSLLDRIGVNAERMGMLIDALLGFGQLSRQPFQPVRLSLDEVVDDVLGWMHADISERALALEREALGEVRADPSLVRIAVANLLSNAIKFTRGREPARIAIGRAVRDNETVYFVRDNGAGFDMRYADKLFGMFQRLHGNQRFEGSGVGLASVQQIVQRHGGRVWAESREGEGATFYFTLNA